MCGPAYIVSQVTQYTNSTDWFDHPASSLMIPDAYFRDSPRFGKDSMLLFRRNDSTALGRVHGLYIDAQRDELFVRMLSHCHVHLYMDADDQKSSL